MTAVGTGSTASTDTIEEVSALLRVDTDDWLEARVYLKDEILAFGRSEVAVLPHRLRPDGAAPTFARAAGTASEPHVPPAPYYSALARWRLPSSTGASTEWWIDQRCLGSTPAAPGYCAGVPNIASLTSPSESRFVDAALDLTAALVAREEALPAISSEAALRRDLLGPLSLMLAGGQSRRPGRIEVCYRKSSTSLFELSGTAQGYASTSGVILVAGADGLRCAVEGSIEGAACSVSAHILLSYASPVSPLAGFATAARAPTTPRGIETTPDSVYTSVADGTPIFAVRPKPGIAGADIGAPGTYEALAGTLLRHPTTTSSAIQYCQYLPVLPDLDARVQDLLAPNPHNLSQEGTNCAGLDENMPIPLEDELISDGDAVENSWRHYLTLARQAANEADALGERVIDDGLTLDVHAEEALAELQDVCGADIDVGGLVDPTLSGMRPVVPEACTSNLQCTASDGDSCIAGRCQNDPLVYAANFPDDPQWNRLRLCLGDDSVEQYASLGTQTLCIWRRSGDPTHYCEGTGSTGLDCPRPAKSDGTCDPLWDKPTPPVGVAPYVWEAVPQTLGFFDDAALTQAPTSPVPCDAIRALRSGVIPADETRESLIRRVQASNIFTAATMAPVGPRIGWEGDLGSVSQLTLDGGTWFTTGTTFGALPASGWPCTTAPSPFFECGTGASADTTSLFCMPAIATCGPDTTINRWARARVNSRWLRAATAAAVLAGGAPRVVVPQTTTRVPGTRSCADADHCRPIPVETRRQLPGGAWLRYYGSAAGRSYISDIPVDAWAATWESGLGADDFSAKSDAPYLQLGPTGLSASGRAEIAGVLSPFYVWRNMGPYRSRDVVMTGYLSRMLFSGERISVGISPIPFHQSVNGALERDFDFAPEAMLDGLELLCEAARSGVGGCDVNTAPIVSRPADLLRAKKFLGCVADSITRQAGSTILYGLPTRALDATRRESASGAFPQLGGEYGAAVSELRAALVDAASVAPLIADELRKTGDDMDRLRLEFSSFDNQDDVASIQFMSTVANQIAACGSSGTPWGAVATCANSIAQIGFADALTDLGMASTDINRRLSINQFRTEFGDRMTSLQNHASQLRAAQERIDSQLATIERLRNQGRRALSRALFGGTDAGTRQIDTASTIRRRLNTQRMRYEDAHQNAIRMSWLARRAIEQRLGMSLADMTDDLPLVVAPSTWEASVCASTGFDFDAIRDGTSATTNFADAYIGDYVTKLEQVVESYRIAYPFHEGEDTVVVSLRDELQNVRDMCDVPVNNLLRYSGRLDTDTDEDANAWRPVGCGLNLTGAPVPNCVSAVPLAGAPIATAYRELGPATPYRVYFGAPPTPAPVTPPESCPATSIDCGLRELTRLAQPVELNTGRYRVSWYARSVPGGSIDPATAWGVSAGAASGTEIAPRTATSAVAGADGWSRYHYIFDVSRAGTYWMALRPVGAGTMLSQSIDVAAVMLEEVTAAIPGAFPSVAPFPPPAPFVATGAEAGVARLALCEDTDGDVFQANGWRRQCLNLCTDGFSSDCGTGSSQSACFWETSFALHGRDIEGGHILNNAGFARGNFNYRIDTVAVNAVGTAARNCEDASLPSTCYNAGFVPYSLYQRGPFIVRNHRGEDYEALLSTGVIEHARALADESYLTNPLSSASTPRVEAFSRAELRGRPLDGSYVLRIWDEPGVNFEGLEDVQIVLRYRYWTRNDI
jgi:hypothetical protein